MRLPPQLSSSSCSRTKKRAATFGLAAGLGLAVFSGSACMQASQTYPLHTPAPAAVPGSAEVVGSLSVERIEGGQRLVVLELSQLPPPERIAPGLKQFVVWLEGPKGKEVNVGTLRYDRTRRSGNLLATTDLTAFTVRVTGERDHQAVTPSGVLLAERRVVTN